MIIIESPVLTANELAVASDAIDAIRNHAFQEDYGHAPRLIFDWSPDGSVDELAGLAKELKAAGTGPVETALCRHPAGPPICWCRPPLPGLPLKFARAHNVDPSRSILIGTGAADRTLATTLGSRYFAV